MQVRRIFSDRLGHNPFRVLSISQAAGPTLQFGLSLVKMRLGNMSGHSLLQITPMFHQIAGSHGGSRGSESA